MRVGERLLHRVVAAETLGGRDLAPVGERRQQQAAGHGLAVEQDGACSADADPAGLADAEQAELAADDVEDRLVGACLELVVGAVDPHA